MNLNRCFNSLERCLAQATRAVRDHGASVWSIAFVSCAIPVYIQSSSSSSCIFHRAIRFFFWTERKWNICVRVRVCHDCFRKGPTENEKPRVRLRRNVSINFICSACYFSVASRSRSCPHSPAFSHFIFIWRFFLLPFVFIGLMNCSSY